MSTKTAHFALFFMKISRRPIDIFCDLIYHIIAFCFKEMIDLKRILTVQDISCVGKCSLTVALPIISAMGVEAAVLPTAVLSTHTMFSGFTFRDLTDDIRPIEEHWKKENIGFDAIYTGYLGSFDQLSIVSEMFDGIGKNAVKIVDPVMADGGKLYKGFTREFAHEMAKLCGKADVIMPNLTETAFMLDEEYIGGKEYTADDIKALLYKLCALGAKTAAITGVSLEKGKLGVMSLDSSTGKFFYYCREHLPASYHGTGDIFASAFTGALARGKSCDEAFSIAADYTVECIALTLADKDSRDYGVNFEQAIPYLLKRADIK